MLPSVSAAIVAGSPDAVLILDAGGRYQDANPAACQLLGYSRDELLRLRSDDLIPADATWLEEARAGYRANGSWRGEIALICKNGDLAPLEAWSVVIPSSDGPLYTSFLRDSTHRKAAEEDFTATHQHTREVLERITDNFYALDDQWRFTYINAATERNFGYARDELIGQNMWERFPQGKDTPFYTALHQARADGHSRTVEFLYPRTSRWYESRIYPSKEGLSVFFRDVTEQKRSEEALRQSEERFRTAFDHAVIGMSLATLEGRFLQVNAALCALTGYAEPELLATTFQAITHPDDVAADLAQVDQLLAGEIPAFQMEKRYLRQEGTIIWVRISTALIRDEHGAPLHLIGQIEDITARVRAEEDLRTSESRYRALVEQLPAVVYVVAADERQTPLYFSAHLETLTGETPGNALAFGEHWLELVHPADRQEVSARNSRASSSGEPFSAEFRRLRTDGSYVWVRDEAVPLRDAAGQIIAWQGVLLDITERKLAEEALRTALAGAQAANRAKGVFLDLMSHELRTPLQAVLGYSEFLLITPKGTLTAEQREDIGYIHQAGDRMITLVNQLLDLSRMEAGGIDLAVEPVDLVQVIEAVRQDVAPQAAAKGLVVQIVLPEALPSVLGDAERVRQILLNLAGNAVKFTSAGHIRITAAATTSGGVEVAVRDTGVGIAADALPHIFEAFRQVDSSLTRRHGGSGLGLAIAWKLAEQMGGRLSVSSELGVGSSFRLQLPGGQPAVKR